MQIGSRLSGASAKTSWKALFVGGRLLRRIVGLGLLFVFLLGGVVACGDEDIELPGGISIPEIPDDGDDDEEGDE